MTYAKTTKQAIERFNNLSKDNTAKLKQLNTKIQNHQGKWGIRKGGEELSNDAIETLWVQNDPLAQEFMDFIYDKGLVPMFDWTGEDKVSKLFVSENQTKYDNLDLETALKLIFIASRKERFASGTLAWAFELGGFPNLINRLVELKTQTQSSE